MEATAAPVLEASPAALTSEHVARYGRDGFLAFEHFLSPLEVEGLKAALSESFRELIEEARAGKTAFERKPSENQYNYSGLRITSSRGKHWVLFEPDAHLDLQKAGFEELELSIRKLSDPCSAHGAFRVLAAHPRLQAMLEALLGPRPILYGDMALCKPPRIGTAKPWHQDSAYFEYEPYDAGVDVWIALDDAAAENGCMFVLPGAHKAGPKKHVHLDDCTLAAGRFDYRQAVPVEMRAGGILLFSVMLPHYTPPNRSDQRRRAVQYFFRGAQTRLISKAEKIAKFVEADGTPAHCAANLPGA